MSIATNESRQAGELLKSFEPISDAQLEEKPVRRAAAAFSSFRKTTFASRAALMVRAAEILEADKERFGRMMTTEMGKTYRSAVDEAAKCAWVCRYYAEHVPKNFLRTKPPTFPEARALCVISRWVRFWRVMPWNFPFWQAFRFIAPSLMAGNVVVAEACVERPTIRT